MGNREYLGDSVYVDDDGFAVRIYTDNGRGPQNIIFLEPSVMIALMQYWHRMELTKKNAVEEAARFTPSNPCR